MTKRTVTFSNYQEPTWEDYTGEDPPPNKWFTGTVKSAKYLADDDQVMFVVEISDPDSPFKGWGRGWYGPLESGEETYWKTQEMVKAIQGGKTTDVTIDFENQKALDAWVAKAKPIKFQTQDYKDRITIRKVRPMLEAVGAPAAKKAAPSLAKAAPEPEAPDDEAIEDYTEEELTELKDDELIEILKDEFEVADDDEDWPKKSRRDRTGALYHKALVDFVLDVQDGDEGDEGDAEGDADPDFDDGFDDSADPDPDPDPEPEPEPEPPARTRRTRGAAKAAAPAAAPAKAAAPAARRRRG